MPILLYGSENWILMECLLKKLEFFQGELAKSILKWPKLLSNTSAMTCVDLSSMCLVSKLGFLLRLSWWWSRLFCSSIPVWWFRWVLFGQRVQRAWRCVWDQLHWSDHEWMQWGCEANQDSHYEGRQGAATGEVYEKASLIVDVPRMLVVPGCGIWHLSWVWSLCLVRKCSAEH